MTLQEFYDAACEAFPDAYRVACTMDVARHESKHAAVQYTLAVFPVSSKRDDGLPLTFDHAHAYGPYPAVVIANAGRDVATIMDAREKLGVA
jgi:hypothetical protein